MMKPIALSGVMEARGWRGDICWGLGKGMAIDGGWERLLMTGLACGGCIMG